jgi:Mrp family chromosome partitioning ATPase
MQGRRVVVVDCDLRGRSLSAQVAGAPQIGFVEVLKGASAVEAALVHDPATGAAFLPVSQAPPPIEDVFSGAAFNDLLEDLRKRFDLVILDMPSVLTVSDARVLAPKCDVVLLLAQWRRTPQQAVREALRVLRVGGSRVAGLALTRVGMQRRVGGSMAAPTPAASRLVGGRNARAGR